MAKEYANIISKGSPSVPAYDVDGAAAFTTQEKAVKL